MSKFYASAIGPAPRSLTCGGCVALDEIRLGVYRGPTQCKRCGKRPAMFVTQGMAKLTDQERMALREIGLPGEGPVSEATFEGCIAEGWGYWGDDGYWHVTAAGRRALELDEAARAS